jgi:hypothetical protein
MKWSLGAVEHNKIHFSIHTAIHNALIRHPTSEHQIIANLVWELPRAVNLIPLTRGWSIRSAGIFVHAQPLVKSKSFPSVRPKSVEIGDLLLLRTEVCGGQVKNRHAMLLQAKMVSHLPAKPDNSNQHHLYANWPSFEYVRSTPQLNGKKRHITGLDLYDASRYLLISDHSCSHPCYKHYWHISPPHSCCSNTASPTLPELSHYRCFAKELLDFLFGDAGKEFVIPPPVRTRNWDRVIEDLIKVTASRSSVFMSRASGVASKARGQGPLLFFRSGDPLPTLGIVHKLWGISSQAGIINDGPPVVPEIWPIENEEGGGISIVEFVVSRTDEVGVVQ